MSKFSHTPIMVNETMELLQPSKGGIFVDGTLGGGGHSSEIAKRLPEGGRLIGIDRDGDAIAAASERLKEYSGIFTPLRGNFFNMRELLSNEGITEVDGILVDLGVSSYQLDTPERGFSYNEDAPLDMRMDKDARLSAYDVVNGYSEEELTRIIRDYGEERFASRIARAIVRERSNEALNSTLELGEIIKRAMPAPARREQQHPAKRTFQAIRIEVNGEINGLYEAMYDMAQLLKSGGTLAVITFHSLEDRPVKQLFKSLEHPCTCDPKAPICTCGKVAQHKILTKKPIVASEDELKANPRSRSAKLRAISKL